MNKYYYVKEVQCLKKGSDWKGKVYVETFWVNVFR